MKFLKKGGGKGESKRKKKGNKNHTDSKTSPSEPTPLSTLSLVATQYSKTRKKFLTNSHVKATWPKEIPCMKKSKRGEKRKIKDKVD